jgi:enterochelin esterase-like enzyme
MRVLTIHPSYRRHPRRVRVFVPTQAEPSPPALVLFDGQNVLEDRGSYAGGWHADRTIEALPRTIRRPILVAIDSGLGRMAELWSELDAFLGFVVREVLPAAEDACRRRFDPDAHGIGGASMGGLASLAAAARHPRLFRKAIAMSPSAWTVPRELGRARYERDARLYVDVGMRESDRMVREAHRAASILEQTLHAPSAQRLFRPDRRGKHREPDWRRRLPKAMRFAFRR